MLRGHVNEMPGDQGAVGGLGADGVGGDGPVSQAHHHHRLVPLGQQGLQNARQGGHRPGEGPLLPAAQAVEVQGVVDPHALAQSLRPGGVGHPDGGEAEAPLPGLGALHPLQLRRVSQQLPGLQGQIGPPCQHSRSSLPQDIVSNQCLIGYFLRESPNYTKKSENLKIILAFWGRFC